MKLRGITYKSGGIRVPLPGTLILLLLLHSSSATALSTDPSAKIDSLQEVLTNTTEDTSRVKLYIALAEAYEYTQIDSAFLLTKMALALSKSINDLHGVVRSQNNLARLESLSGNPDQSIKYLRQSLSISRQINDSTLLQLTHYYIGAIYIGQSNFQQALNHCQQSLALAEATRDTLHIASTLRILGVIYFELEQYDHTIQLLERALSMLQPSDHSHLAAIYNNLGNSYSRKKDYKLSQHYHNLTLQLVRTMGNRRGEASVLNNIAVMYKNMHQYKTALSYAKQSQSIYHDYYKTQPEKYNYVPECTLGSIYEGLQQYQQARAHYNNAMISLKEGSSLTGYIEICTNLIRLDSLEGNFKQALVRQQRLMAVKDSLAHVENTKALEELKIQYETEQKDQEIVLLQAQSDRQQLEARQQRFFKNSFVAGSVILCLLLGLGYNRYRFKQRALGVMRQQKEEILLQKQQVEQKNQQNQLLLKEVHHRVKNNLQIVLSILNAQADSLRDAQTVAAIRESQHRVHSMALIHQSLYQSDDLSHIQAREYLQEMVETVCQSYRSEAKPVRLRLQVEDLAMNMSTAVPVGLIVTELVTNACKHALLEADSELSVTLRAETTTQYRLTVADNGPGLPPDFNVDQANSLGLQLVHGLTQQLDGELVVQNGTGACFELLFHKAA